ncbi:hypothetical protein LYZ37_12795 [Vibrio tubiashii]|uniref:hypothetical protein n=1 Tax=Vibrio tubiashii TaxID=29498 RepID=UPI00234E66A3|nr:hypothetical protein [Vibrio tubiashii]WCP66714.1 hypothetical protein LYZ37_12795 [Vibrio tubiashii]
MTVKQYRFPTIGEVVKELFNATGILPQKHAQTSVVMDEKHKKTIQKSLERLAKEDSKIDSQLDDALDIFSNILYELVEDEKLTLAFMASVQDTLAQYKDLVRGEGTYLSLADTIRWVIPNRLIDRVLTCLFKNSLAFQVNHFNSELPDNTFWWLPEYDHRRDNWCFPLTKTWQWIYTTQGMSQTRFHNPMRDDSSYQFDNELIEKYKKYERNLENAQRWTSGKQLPNIHALVKNLDESLAASSYCFDENMMQYKCYKMMLLISRLTTSITKSIQKSYGNDFLVQLIRDIKKQHRRYKIETLSFEVDIHKALTSVSTQHTEYLQAWRDLTQYFWGLRADNLIKNLSKVERYLKQHGSQLSKHRRTKVLINNLGASNVYALVNQTKHSPKASIPTMFPNLFTHGLNLKSKAVSLQEIQGYKQEVESAKLHDRLGWIVEWATATYYYRKEAYNDAHLHYSQAFKLARYVAGNQQHLLVNQYIESCAKVQDYREFKKAVAWANYLDIKVRWLRSFKNPETEENLRFLYRFMGITRYWRL